VGGSKGEVIAVEDPVLHVGARRQFELPVQVLSSSC
jgi:hypothetical protein